MTENICYFSTVPFEAARKVEILPEGHPSRNLHGHSFLVQVRALLPEHWITFAGTETSLLEKALTSCVHLLDYSYLNDILAVPTDENLARWIYSNCDVPNINNVGIQSTLCQGANLDKDNHAHIWKRFRFEAAHQLPNVPAGHKCGRMHGHGFEVVLHAYQGLDQENMGVDFDSIGSIWSPIQEQFQYACLNDITGLENPTSEMIAYWIWKQLESKMPELSWVTVYETSTAGCHYDGNKFHIWKEQNSESASRLLKAPTDDPRSKVFGHSYVIRLHLTSPLDNVMGWTVDYGDVKELFKPVYKKLDHHYLNDLPGIHDGDTGTVLKWIKNNMMDILPQLERIDLFEKPGTGATLSCENHDPILPV